MGEIRLTGEGGGLARAAIDGGEWSGAGGAPATVALRATPALRRLGASPPAPLRRGALAVAAAISLAVHMAIFAVATLNFSPPQPSGEPNVIAVELVATADAAPPPNDAVARRIEEAPVAPAATVSQTTTISVPAEAAQPVATPSERPTESASPAREPAPDADPAVAAAAPIAPSQAPPLAAGPTAEPPDERGAASLEVPAANEAAAPAEIAAIPPAATPPAPPDDVAPRPTAAAPPEAAFSVRPNAPQLRPRAPAHAIAAAKAATRAAQARASSLPSGASGGGAYRDALLARIRSLTRYPEPARERGATGVATVHFALDGGGAVTLVDLTQSSGDRALDDEAVAAVRRASPLPPPPADAPRAYSAPIRYELR